MKTMKPIKSITLTMFFQGSAINRNGTNLGNVSTLKKLHINGQMYPYISASAMRHYMRYTLYKGYDWFPYAVTEKKGKVLIDVLKDTILSNPVLDAFGYLYPISESNALSRKAPVQVTKAISLFPYQNDISVGANHAQVQIALQRGYKAFPSLHYKEEHVGLYTWSLSLDSARLGYDEWVVIRYDEKNKIAVITQKNKENGTSEELSCQLSEVNGRIEYNNNIIKFILDDEHRITRILNILDAVRGGLCASASGEDGTIVPIALVVGAVKVPTSVFNNYLSLKRYGDDWLLTGLSDCINNIHVDGPIYIYASESVILPDIRNSKRVTTDWEKFLEIVGLKK